MSLTHTAQACKSNRSLVDLAGVLRKIESLGVMTVECGCTSAEAEVAARKIGEAVQRYDLVLPLPPASHVSERAFAIANIEVIAETERALLCVIDGHETRVPRSQVMSDREVAEKGDFGTLVVTRWFAERARISEYAKSLKVALAQSSEGSTEDESDTWSA